MGNIREFFQHKQSSICAAGNQKENVECVSKKWTSGMKGAAGRCEAFQGVLAEEDGDLQLLGLLLLLLDLGLQRVAEGLGPCAVEGEFRLVLLLLGFSHLDS